MGRCNILERRIELGKWRPIRDEWDVSEFFGKNEPYSVSAYAKFLEKTARQTWVLQNKDNAVLGALVQSGRTLYPVLDIFEKKKREWKISHRLKKNIFNNLYAINGSADDVEVLEGYAAEWGLFPSERTLYDFMTIDTFPPAASVFPYPAGLILRRPGAADMDALFQLQSAYEKEEVLPKSAKFDPAVCRMLLERIVSREQVLVAELRGDLVGKINTNAVTPATFRIGGVYVLPAYRGRGIAARMTSLFTQALLETGKQVSLFVKKNNVQARAVYSRAGFKTLVDYRISYY